MKWKCKYCKKSFKRDKWLEKRNKMWVQFCRHDSTWFKWMFPGKPSKEYPFFCPRCDGSQESITASP